MMTWQEIIAHPDSKAWYAHCTSCETCYKAWRTERPSAAPNGLCEAGKGLLEAAVQVAMNAWRGR